MQVDCDICGHIRKGLKREWQLITFFWHCHTKKKHKERIGDKMKLPRTTFLDDKGHLVFHNLLLLVLFRLRMSEDVMSCHAWSMPLWVAMPTKIAMHLCLYPYTNLAALCLRIIMLLYFINLLFISNILNIFPRFIKC